MAYDADWIKECKNDLIFNFATKFIQIQSSMCVYFLIVIINPHTFTCCKDEKIYDHDISSFIDLHLFC